MTGERETNHCKTPGIITLGAGKRRKRVSSRIMDANTIFGSRPGSFLACRNVTCIVAALERERSRGGWPEHQCRASARLRGRRELSRRQETRLVVPSTGQNMGIQLPVSSEIF